MVSGRVVKTSIVASPSCLPADKPSPLSAGDGEPTIDDSVTLLSPSSEEEGLGMEAFLISLPIALSTSEILSSTSLLVKRITLYPKFSKSSVLPKSYAILSGTS